MSPHWGPGRPTPAGTLTAAKTGAHTVSHTHTALRALILTMHTRVLPGQMAGSLQSPLAGLPPPGCSDDGSKRPFGTPSPTGQSPTQELISEFKQKDLGK